MTSPLQAATAFRDRGWRPIPLLYRDKQPAGPWATKAATEPTDQMLELWFGRTRVNVGIACKHSGLLVVDSDTPGALEKFAAERGETLPTTYRVRTRKDWHWYFDATEYPELGNSPGELGPCGMDIRGGGDNEGGYVVAAGSVHETGHVYIAEDEHVVPAMLPGWLAEAISTPVPGTTGPGAASRPIGGWSDEERHGTAVDLHAQYQRHLNGVQHRGGLFRHELFLAALDGWRLVDLGLLPENDMLAELAAQVELVWGKGPDDNDRRIVYVEARAKATDSPWALLGGTKLGPDGPAAGDSSDPTEVLTAEEIEARAIEREVAARVRALDVDEIARARRAARKLREQPSVLDGLIDSNDLDDLPDPRMLLGEFIPEAAVGVIAGKFGSYKSFVTVSWACALAAGRSWLDRDEFAVPEAVPVLYVAAEGASGMKLRRKAWVRKFGSIDRGQLSFFPRPIKLTDPIAVTSLEEAIVERGFKVVFIDTLHRSAPGAEENSSTELGLVFEAACRLRDDHGITVVFVDHTGHSGERPRGSSIKVDDSDFVILIDRPGEAATSDIQRTLKMHKRKDLDTDGEWPIRLQLVEGTGSGYVELGAVDAADDSPFGVTEEWHSLASEEIPAGALEQLQVVARARKGKGKAAALDIFRLLRFVGGERGMTQGDIQGTLSEGPRTHHRSSVHAGLGLLSEAGLLVPGATEARFLIAPQYV